MSFSKNRFIHVFGITLLTVIAAPAAAQDIATISHGERVNITRKLAPGKLTVVDFYADWCGPCRSIAPKLERLAAGNPETVAIRKVDIVNWQSEVSAQYRIQSIPHLILFDENGLRLAEGSAYEVMRVLKRRLGGESPDSGNTRSMALLLFIGGLVALVLYFLLRGRSSKQTSHRLPPPTPSTRATASGWFVMMQNSLEGPFADEDLEELLKKGKISGTAKARRRGQSTWTTVGSIFED